MNGQHSNNNKALTLLGVVVVIAVLRFAREFIIPLVLAILLAFVLAPMANWLGRAGVRRGLANAVVVMLSFVVMGGLGSLIATQLVDLAHQLPGYQQNIDKKMNAIRTSGGGILKRISTSVHDFSESLTPASSAPQKGRTEEAKPVPVEIRQMPFSPLELIRTVLGSVVDVIMVFFIVIVFVVFLLSQRQDLRQRLLQLGKARPTDATSNVIDEAAGKVSRYLLAQLAVNGAYGFAVGLATLCIGIPNPLLWGVLAAILRYIPYLGIWVAAVMPAAVALAVDPGFGRALLILGFYVAIDAIVYNFIEPFLYGKTTGLTPLAVLAAALFWTWLWGPVGLLLSTPLTLCVVALSRNVPDLSFFSVLLSDEPGRAHGGLWVPHRESEVPPDRKAA